MSCLASMLKVLFMLCVLFKNEHFQEKRLLLVFTDKASNPLFVKQQDILNSDPNGLKERDLKVIVYFVDKDAAMFNKRKIEAGFTVILVGKDGGDKLKSTQPLTLKKLYSTIDAMPMRQSEMRQRP